jgi:hypothetical protein
MHSAPPPSPRLRSVYGRDHEIRACTGRLMRQRGERIERSFAHLYDTGGMRRTQA